MATLTASTAQLLTWIVEAPRTYAQTIERWQTSCPRLAVWEDALADGLVRIERGSVRLTSTGRELRRRNDARPGVRHERLGVFDPDLDVRAVVLVEGTSDKIALERLAARRGRDLVSENVDLVPIGGAQAIGRFLEQYRRERPHVRLGGLCDAGEERGFRRALERAGLGENLGRAELERLGFYVCEADLEDELVRALGAAAVEGILAEHGRLGSFRTYQKQPAHRGRSIEQQLRGFLTNWKIRLAAPLVDALDLDRVPRPLDQVLAHVTN